MIGMCAAAEAHDIVTTPVTWDREISRIFYSRCVACHREGGRAFSLMQYQESFPWRTAIKEEVLERRMPPWGAVKGFGDFRNDQALTPEELELLTSWSQGGSPEGEEKDLPAKDKLNEMMKESAWFDAVAEASHSARQPGAIAVKGDFKLVKTFNLDGLLAKSVPPGSYQIIAELPDGGIEQSRQLRALRHGAGGGFARSCRISSASGCVAEAHQNWPAGGSYFRGSRSVEGPAGHEFSDRA